MRLRWYTWYKVRLRWYTWHLECAIWSEHWQLLVRPRCYLANGDDKQFQTHLVPPEHLGGLFLKYVIIVIDHCCSSSYLKFLWILSCAFSNVSDSCLNDENYDTWFLQSVCGTFLFGITDNFSKAISSSFWSLCFHHYNVWHHDDILSSPNEWLAPPGDWNCE